MYSTTVDVDDISNPLAETVPGFSGEATVTVRYWDANEFELRDVEIVVWRNGSFRTQAASDPLAEAIREEIWGRSETLRRISEQIEAETSERRYFARDRLAVMER